jgi:hypothetical protein
LFRLRAVAETAEKPGISECTRPVVHVLFATAPWGLSGLQQEVGAARLPENRVFPRANVPTEQWHADCFMPSAQTRFARFVTDTKTKKVLQDFFGRRGYCQAARKAETNT